jgi:hypothetical protein
VTGPANSDPPFDAIVLFDGKNLINGLDEG